MSQTRIKAKKRSRKKNGARIDSSLMYWTAVGTLAAYTTFGVAAVPGAYAQQSGGAPPARETSGQTQSLGVHRFDIAPGPLEIVLARFQETSQLSVTITDGMRGIWSPGVAGLYTPVAALAKLLTGTGIAYHLTTPTTAVLKVEGTSTAIEVTATSLQNTIPLYTQPLAETPQSIDVVPQNVIQDQGVATLRDTLRNVAGISIAAGEGGAQGDSLTIRGFTARNDIFLDGMRDFGSYYRDPFNTEEVEVLQGPSSVTFGRGSTGGIVNQETKVPQLKPSLGGSLEFGTDRTKRITADLDTPLPSLGEGAAFRLNAMGHDSSFAGRDVAESRRAGIAPSLAFGLGTPTRFIVSYLHESADDTPDYGIPWLFDGPAPVDRRNYYGFRRGNFLKTNVDMGTVRFEHDVNASISVRNQLRFARYHRDVRITEPQIDTSTFDSDPLTTPLDKIGVLRNEITVNSKETFLQDQADVTLKFRTGSLRHVLVAGAEGGRETSSPNRPRFDIQTVPKTSLLSPDTHQTLGGSIASITDTQVAAVSSGAYVLDTATLLPKLDLTAGVRVDTFEATVNQLTPVVAGSPFKQFVVIPSWRAALVYKPVTGTSIYFAYGTSFNPSAETLALTAATQSADPEESRTLEVGSKWDWYAQRLSMRAAIFRTDKTNARETVSPTEVALSGSQRVNGVQLQVNGYLTSRWEILAGYAYLDSKVTASKVFPASVGAQLANVPRNTFSMWTTYDLPWRLSVGAGADFVDRRTASSTTPLDPITGLVKQVPGYWTFNAMAKYPLGERVDLRLNVYNLTDKYYYDQIHPAHIVPGPARSAALSLNIKF